ncbi:HNH endonuclease family protein [Heliomicrobium gestii]|uniref:hypothetical protein n=1 Tax=Heliomicrobium gestii TaxID=2699 RepID=UPI00195DDB21|nr:hypothetical protein [Heliomicrobium gestii]MBM7865675.1 uncharacterized protein (TIGR02646 family) [Heliomicrobium gestii]
MIPVQPQPEPVPLFDEKVRRPGNAWLEEQGFDLDQPAPDRTKVRPYWRDCLPELHKAYKGICAYTCLFIELGTGGASVDHFVPKSSQLRVAYEWTNYRLAGSKINSRKRDFTDVIDPFEVKPDMFYLELVTGAIYPNPKMPQIDQELAKKTINRLGLDRSDLRETRARHYQDYCQGEFIAEHLRKYSPFVWKEAHRQGLL